MNTLGNSFYKSSSSELLEVLVPTDEPFESIDSPGIILVSLAHSPKSISLQRSQQKGLKRFLECQVFSLPQVGQEIFDCLFILILIDILINTVFFRILAIYQDSFDSS